MKEDIRTTKYFSFRVSTQEVERNTILKQVPLKMQNSMVTSFVGPTKDIYWILEGQHGTGARKQRTTTYCFLMVIAIGALVAMVFFLTP